MKRNKVVIPDKPRGYPHRTVKAYRRFIAGRQSRRYGLESVVSGALAIAALVWLFLSGPHAVLPWVVFIGLGALLVWRTYKWSSVWNRRSLAIYGAFPDNVLPHARAATAPFPTEAGYLVETHGEHLLLYVRAGFMKRRCILIFDGTQPVADVYAYINAHTTVPAHAAP